MPRPIPSSPQERGLGPTTIEEGRIVNVDMKRWTLDVHTSESQRQFIDIPWSSPYLHFANGEGMYCMPEVGAKCMICKPADGPPFVLCFTTPFENLNEESNHPSSSETTQRNITYRAGRPNLQQGDLMLRTRDGNKIWLRRGGIVEIGSTAISKRLYIPLLNYIRDICENYELLSAGGYLSWTVTRSDSDPDNEANALLTIFGREHAQDQNGSIIVQLGHIDDSKRLKVVIAPNVINTRTGEYSSSVFELLIDDEGNVETTQNNSDSTIKGELDWTIEGSAKYTYQSNFEESISGNYKTEITGTHSLDAQSSKETLQINKVIEAPNIKLGSSTAIYPVVLATPTLMAYLMSHTHTVLGATTGPPTTPPVVPNMVYARKVFGE